MGGSNTSLLEHFTLGHKSIFIHPTQDKFDGLTSLMVSSFAYNSGNKEIYMWCNGDRHLMYDIPNRKWVDASRTSSQMFAKSPDNVESPIIRGCMISVVNNQFWLFKLSSNDWSEGIQLPSPLKARERIHLSLFGKNVLCVLYVCTKGKLNCYIYEVGNKEFSLVNGGIYTLSKKVTDGKTYDVLEASHLSTASSLYLMKTKRESNKIDKIQNMELNFHSTGVKNQYCIRMPEDKDDMLGRSFSLLFKNKVQHSINHSKFLPAIIPSDGKRPCMHEGWSVPLGTVLKDKDLWIHNSVRNQYEMSGLWNTITLKLLKILVSHKKQGRWIKGINRWNIVFQEHDKQFMNPQSIDCLVLSAEASEDTIFKSLATLIESTITFNINCLGPNIRTLLNCLHEQSPYSQSMIRQKKWKYLLGHPSFMTSDENVSSLIQIRDTLRGDKAIDLKVQLKELAGESYVSTGNWNSLILQNGIPTFIKERVNLLIKNELKDASGKPVTYDMSQVSGVIKFLRDTLEHANDNYKSMRGHAFYTNEDYATGINSVAPGLLPYYFNYHGSLRARYEKAF
ncbi:uncharacterized protein LOC113286376 [Papaver somniferum]|nr:uncharacterized protein LOC113286376 [Papaver somniferum]